MTTVILGDGKTQITQINVIFTPNDDLFTHLYIRLKRFT